MLSHFIDFVCYIVLTNPFVYNFYKKITYLNFLSVIALSEP